MRAWRTSGGTLVDEGPSEVTIVSPLSEEVPQGPWREHRRYVLLDGEGNVRSRYHDSTWSVEDELGASLHAIIDGTLRELTVTLITFGNWTVGRRETTVVGDLREIGADDAESWRWIRAALASDEAKAVKAADDYARARAARMADLAGALQDFGAGPEFRRAQEVLRARVESSDGALEAALLRALGQFGALHRSLGKPVRAALDEFVRACRRAAFDATLKKGKAKAAAPLPAPVREGARALSGTLDQLRKELLEKSVEEDWADRSRNAAEYRKAADHVAAALERLK